jgi:hypothetical protein
MLRFFSLAMTRAVRRWRLLYVDRDQAWISPCGFCGGRSGAGIGFSLHFFSIIPPVSVIRRVYN